MKKPAIKHIFIILLIGIALIFASCNKNKVPVLTTSDVTAITNFTATCGGTVIDEGSSAIISLGVCWNTEPEPTISDF